MVKVTKSVIEQNIKTEVSWNFNLAQLGVNRSEPESTRLSRDAHRMVLDNRAPRVEGFPKNTYTHWTTYFLVFFTRGAYRINTYRAPKSMYFIQTTTQSISIDIRTGIESPQQKFP